MQVKLIKDARIKHKAGDIVEVSPIDANYLVATGQAVPVAEKKETARKQTKK